MIDHPKWFFMWDVGIPYITRTCAWTRAALIREVEEDTGKKWKRIYRQGGRAVKCTVKVKK